MHNAFVNVQLNNIDSYQAVPSRLDQTSVSIGHTKDYLNQVPVLRVFGKTDDSRTIVVHVHGVFPYLYVKYEGKLDEVDEYREGLYHTINRMLCASLKRDVNDPKNKFVANIVVCKGVPFYGYHVGWAIFLKIYLVNSNYTLRLADLFRNGHILGAKMQPFESHIPHILQFFSDFNLYGCGWLKLQDAYFRTDSGSSIIGTATKTSYCELEADITADLIMNRKEIEQQMIHATFDGHRTEKKQYVNLRELWEEDEERRTRLGKSSFKTPKNTQRDVKGKWYRHDEFLNKFEQIAVGDNEWEFNPYDDIPTAFDAVQTMLKPKRTDDRQSEIPPHNNGLQDSDDDEAYEEEEEPPPEVGELAGLEFATPAKRVSTMEPSASAKRTRSSSASLFNLSQSSRSNATRYSSFDNKDTTLFGVMRRFGGRRRGADSGGGQCAALRAAAPSKRHVLKTLEQHGAYQPPVEPFYGNEKDVPAQQFNHAGVEHKVGSTSVNYLPSWFANDELSPATGVKILQYLPLPPSKSSLQIYPPRARYHQPTSSREVMFKGSGRAEYMNVLTVEVHSSCKPGKLPNPKTDRIDAVFWRLLYDETFDQTAKCGILAVGSMEFLRRLELTSKWQVVNKLHEIDLFNSLIQMVRYYDPDILAGYELQKSSWGYLIDRAAVLGIDLMSDLSRIKNSASAERGNKWGLTHTTDIAVTGRYMLNIWRIVRKEVALTQYTLESVVWHCFKERIPLYSAETLTKWWDNGAGMELGYVLDYYTSRLDNELRIIVKQELVGRYSEQARIIGIDYNSVHYRGSQFQVESFLARLTKKENFVMVSPSKKQVGEQNALEFIPLVMEPESQFYTSPVLVLDFQSLYPSIVIAYNYCYSTFLGRINAWQGRNKMGFTDLEIPDGLLAKLKQDVDIAPNGIMYAKQNIRKSLLATMLTELLETRVMIKEGMKFQKDNVAFQKSMNNRQMALKLIANVTYGYTSASFSGRMPCSEIADSIVLSGREVLERAIDTIQSNEKWGADVVYGDTDSLFVHLPGKSRQQAFDIGEDIARVVTKQNRDPIKLKFEKVYDPCILQTKKRYVGYKYESKSQTVPVFDAKGTETVRRDGTPIEAEIEEKALRIIFETKDLSQVKEFLLDEWGKIMAGQVQVEKFCFAKEVKLGSYKGNILPAGAAISAAKMANDERAEPQYRERVPYVVVNGAPQDRLIDRCVAPEYLLKTPDASLDARYYITKNLIPPLERMFNMMGANIRQWYEEMPKTLKVKGAYSSTSCVICHRGNTQLCTACQQTPSVMYTLAMQRRSQERLVQNLEVICRMCANQAPGAKVECVSGDCPVYYDRVCESHKIDW